MNQLRAIVQASSNKDFWQAQLLELDVAVSASSFDEIVREIEYALILEYRIARERNQTPFANLVRGLPFDLHSAFDNGPNRQTRELDLPDEVMDALSIALHTPKKQTFSVQPYTMAA